MSCEVLYEIIVPKNNIEIFKKYILQGIYGLTEHQLWFLDPNYCENDFYGVKLVRETPKFYEIKFRISGSVPLINALPFTKVTVGTIFFANREILKYTKLLIRTVLYEKHISLEYYNASKSTKVHITTNDVLLLIKQLAASNIVQKFYALDGPGMFICISRNIPIVIASVNGVLEINIERNLIFDHDLGFTGRNDIVKLNKLFVKWVEKGDIREQIIKPNDITVVD